VTCRPRRLSPGVADVRVPEAPLLILHPNEALVASQLSPRIRSHYSIAAAPLHRQGHLRRSGHQLPHEFLRIDEYLAQTESASRPPEADEVREVVPVLEHIELEALRKLYLVTTDGAVLGLDQTESARLGGRAACASTRRSPAAVVVASNFEPKQFGPTSRRHWSKGPKIFFAEWTSTRGSGQAKRDHVVQPGPLPNVNPTNLRRRSRNLRKTHQEDQDGQPQRNLDLTSYKNISRVLSRTREVDLLPHADDGRLHDKQPRLVRHL